MTMIAFITALSFACLTFAGEEAGKKITFEGAKVGTLPKGWKTAKTGKGTGGDWKIVEDKDTPGGLSLAQTKADKTATFNICVAEGTSYQDIDLTVSFKALAGDRDQGGGPVWRFQDENNYYVARMNPLEGDFRLFRVIGGKRTQLGDTVKVATKVGEWHTITVRHRGENIDCFFDDKQYFDLSDGSIT